MKTIIKLLSITFVFLFFAWGIESYGRIIARSNIDHPLNAFNVLVELGSKKSIKGTVTKSNVIECGHIEVTDVKGETWVVEVTDTEEIPIGTKCKIKYHTQGTTNIYDDEIIDIKF